MSFISNISYFIIQLLFNLIIYMLWIRILLHYFKFSSLHPLNRTINSLTGVFLTPLEQLFNKNIAPMRYDVAGFSALVVVEIIKLCFLNLLFFTAHYSLGAILLFIVADLIIQFANVLFYLILVSIIMSWSNPHGQNPVYDFVFVVTAPLIKIGHKIIPNISGFDFAPWFMIVIIQLMILFINSLLPIYL